MGHNESPFRKDSLFPRFMTIKWNEHPGKIQPRSAKATPLASVTADILLLGAEKTICYQCHRNLVLEPSSRGTEDALLGRVRQLLSGDTPSFRRHGRSAAEQSISSSRFGFRASQAARPPRHVANSLPNPGSRSRHRIGHS